MVDPWSMVHLQSMVQDEDATMLRLSGKIFSMYLDDSGSFLYVFGVPRPRPASRVGATSGLAGDAGVRTQ